MTKPNEREKAKKQEKKKDCGGHINFFLLVVFSRFSSSFTHPENDQLSSVFSISLSSTSFSFATNPLVPLIFYRSSKKHTHTHIETQYEFVDNLQVAQGYVCVCYTTNGFFDLYTRT